MESVFGREGAIRKDGHLRMEMKKINIKITGKVQGVFFRASTKAVADQMGIKGLVKNEKDGSVYIEAEN